MAERGLNQIEEQMPEQEKTDGPALEEMFAKVDRIVKQMEEESVSLEESFRLYNDGMQLLKKCNDTIDTVEKKVLVLDEDGETHEF